LNSSQKKAIICDNMSMKKKVPISKNKAGGWIKALHRGTAFTAKDLTGLAASDAIRQILVRLTRDGVIRRVRRGVYEKPARSSILKAPAAPDTDAVARAIARAHGWTITPSGQTALNRLGLSTQVPASWQYFSDGPSKTYPWAGGTITFKHRTNRETTGLSPKTALIVRALKALGKAGVDDMAIDVISRALTPRDFNRALKEARYTTAWVYSAIQRLADRGGAAHG
jgi:hypothetical protein